MSESGGSDQDHQRDAASPQAGVLGNLPRARPSVRSPRRATPQAAAADEAVPAVPDEPDAQASSQAELEALARSGLAIAGGAATLGLRIAGRAAAAVRGAVERR